MNPYSNTDLFSFLLLLLQRVPLLLSGRVSLAHDELQLLVLLSMGICSSIVGTFLILRRMAMLANALSHTILLGILLAYWLSMRLLQTEAHSLEPTQLSATLLFLSSAVMALVTMFLTQLLTHQLQLQPEASCALTFTTLFALGIIFITAISRNAHVGTELLFGNVDALQLQDLSMVSVALIANILMTFFLFKEYALTSFDRGYASSIGYSNTLFDYLLMIQTSITLISSFRAVGVLMVLALLTAPVLTAKLFCKHLWSCICLASAISALAALLGISLSRHLLSLYGMPLSTAGITVLLLALIFFIALLYRSNFLRTCLARS